jgi:transposase
MLLQLAWLWLRHQPDSVLSQWFLDRVKANGGRLKKPTIVALARKLLVALWKYVTSGVVIEGAIGRMLLWDEIQGEPTQASTQVPIPPRN